MQKDPSSGDSKAIGLLKRHLAAQPHEIESLSDEQLGTGALRDPVSLLIGHLRASQQVPELIKRVGERLDGAPVVNNIPDFKTKVGALAQLSEEEVLVFDGVMTEHVKLGQQKSPNDKNEAPVILSRDKEFRVSKLLAAGLLEDHSFRNRFGVLLMLRVRPTEFGLLIYHLAIMRNRPYG